MRPSSVHFVPKESIVSLHFPKEPVRLSEAHRAQLKRRVEMAMHLGNGQRGKCRILFRDREGLKAVETTIWYFDETSILLKHGISIPMGRVIDVMMPH
ncbi:MAG: hypothetical protein KDB88_01010 [Flavobacteriales bacterium]|nr:hypothetical protein [Flavobacteriales bacterium]